MIIITFEKHTINTLKCLLIIKTNCEDSTDDYNGVAVAFILFYVFFLVCGWKLNRASLIDSAFQFTSLRLTSANQGTISLAVL